MNKSVLQKIGVIIMGILLSGSVGFNISGVGLDNDKVSSIVKDELKTIIVDAIQDELAPIKNDISELKECNRIEITTRAIASYSKIKTIEDLKNNPSNRVNILLGLKMKSCYDILMTIDHDRTLLFYNYLISDNV